jgi:dTDP-4-amino-4,6-dideoxygalactose transaminase
LNKKIENSQLFTPWTSYSKEEISAVSNVLQSNKVNYWTGSECREFEKEFSEWTDVKFSISLANGTIALEMALKALNIFSKARNNEKPEVIVTSRTFIASASSIVNIGALPVFVDVDRDTQNITAETIEAAITKNTRAIICVHIAGWPCEMDKIKELASANDLYVIEDCAQAHGARYKNQMVGSFGDIAAWSFCQDKIISTGGEGGMITTNDETLWRRVWALKDHGKSYCAVHESESPKNKYRWLHESIGTNGRMTEMQAAIGRIQIRKMAEWREARNRNATTILDCCGEFSKVLRVAKIPNYVEHAWYKCYVFIRPEGLKQDWSRDKIINEMNFDGVPCFSGSCSEVYLEKAFSEKSFQPKNRLPFSKELGETSLMFLVHPTLTDKEIELTCKVIRKVMNLAKK